MRKIPLTRGQVAIVDDDDYEWLSHYKWHATWNNSTSSFMAARHYRSEKSPIGRWRSWSIMMHRQILPVAPGLYVDHANRNTLDNRRLNLRSATRRQNTINRRKWGTMFKHKGLFQNGNRITARIIINGRRKSVGTFKTIESAAEAYNRSAKEHYGEFAVLNTIEEVASAF